MRFWESSAIVPLLVEEGHTPTHDASSVKINRSLRLN